MRKALLLEGVVRKLCREIDSRLSVAPPVPWTERELRREMVGCVLASRVRHEMACIGVSSLENAGAFDEWWDGLEDGRFETRVCRVLAGDNACGTRAVRFYRSKAAQITAIRGALRKWPLSSRLRTDASARDVRRQLTKELDGVGPKQASAFLRNVGFSYSLAIIDAHVLRYMDCVGLADADGLHVSGLASYERVEEVVVRYASDIGYPPGYLDWAIWATMRASRELGL